MSRYAWACVTSADCAKRLARPWCANASCTPFTSIHDITRRVSELRKDELTTLAEIGALNSVGLQIEDFKIADFKTRSI